MVALDGTSPEAAAVVWGPGQEAKYSALVWPSPAFVLRNRQVCALRAWSGGMGGDSMTLGGHRL